MVHSFFRSIGFSTIRNNADLYEILEEVVGNPDEQAVVKDADGNEFACFSKTIGGDMGVSVCGHFTIHDEFRMDYYFPYFRGSNITTHERVELEKHSATESYAGICDEMKLGVTLIFYVNNVIDVLHEKKFSGKNMNINNTVISALAYSGKILLPVMKTEKYVAMKQKSSEKRLDMIQQARDGSREAMEKLTLNDMDVYSSIGRRIARKEDVLSIVESSFIPYGIESDQYVIIGEILNFYKIPNMVTKENIYIMSILCNDLTFDVCINEKDLYGEPEVGRRFKGRIWLQGHLNFGY